MSCLTYPLLSNTSNRHVTSQVSNQMETYTSQLPLKAHFWSRVIALARVGLRELAAATILFASNIINAVPGGVADSQAYSEAA